MSKWWMEHKVLCHWCGKLFNSKKGRLQARFCSSRCKQAHYRAYKKYVTAKGYRKPAAGSKPVTRKTPSTPPATKGRKQKKNE